ncbi:MAG: hypothetical protein M3Q69_05080 [Acidobacteriota bacterium]|nr:hypothetical protein [Acidobacteriota bacterium]
MNALRWPALDLQASAIPEQLAYERGIWGKVHGAPSDYRWIAKTAAFNGPRTGLERELTFGAEDAPATFTAWSVRGNTCYAISCYPSAARDASSRSGFLEKQIVQWERPAATPAALAALLLSPAVAAFDASIHWEDSNDPRWAERDFSLDLDEGSHRPLPVAGLEAAIEHGLRTLRTAVSQEGLAELYASLLAGGRAVALRESKEPLPPAALAALLLPLPRALADTVSMTAWLPSNRVSDAEELRRQWTIIAAGASAIPSLEVTPDREQVERGRLMASCVFQGDPSPLVGSADSGAPIRLTLWGPSAAGKTVLLANLYLQRDDDWDVYPTGKSLAFVQHMRGRMQTSNFFPPATTVNDVQGIEYLFRHRRTGVSASLALEDRAGADWERLAADGDGDVANLKKRLAAADGLVLLFDPLSDQATLGERVWSTLELVHVDDQRGVQKDERPIAVCVSKADVLIETAEDFLSARDTPDLFVRQRVPPAMIDALDRFCSNYRLFPVSAAGVRLRHGVVEPAVFFDEQLQPRICPGGRAFNLMTPFSWLLDRLTEARS